MLTVFLSAEKVGISAHKLSSQQIESDYMYTVAVSAYMYIIVRA